MNQSLDQRDPLTDFARRDYTFDGTTRRVYVAGTGPAVLVLSEMPGISPQVARFARWLRAAGLTVFMPSLFGEDGAVAGAEAGIEVFRRVCVSAEFRALADGGETPVVTWLRQLARSAFAECGGRGVGAIGMCFTGNFALSLMLEPVTRAAVACQPSLPLDNAAAIALHPDEARAIRQRLESEKLTVLAYRFAGDRWCTAARFAAYQAALGPRFECRELPDDAANPEPPAFFRQIVACPHSVVTAHLIDQQGQPTLAARDEIIAFLQSRLINDLGKHV